MTLAKPSIARKKPGTRDARYSLPDATALLGWYDKHRRILPWRAGPGQTSDPYMVWLSEIMLQQTTVKAVAPYYTRFLQKWPTVQALAGAAREDVLRSWAGLGYYARARNLHACAQQIVRAHGGKFPRTETELETLPGIGGYTAAMIASIAFDRPVVAIDGNVERVVSRLFALEEALPAAKPEIRRLTNAIAPQSRRAHRSGDFAQAMMDLGATICTPKSPACVLCPWMDACKARARGDQEIFPRKTPKRAGEMRRGAAFVVLRKDGCVLLRRRPEQGLLGGMSEVPGSEWRSDLEEPKMKRAAPKFSPAVPWRRLSGSVEHVFTHFPLRLGVYFAQVPRGTSPPNGMRWVRRAALADEALPSVMRKVIAHALDNTANQTAKS